MWCIFFSYIICALMFSVMMVVFCVVFSPHCDYQDHHATLLYIQIYNIILAYNFLCHLIFIIIHVQHFLIYNFMQIKFVKKSMVFCWFLAHLGWKLEVSFSDHRGTSVVCLSENFWLDLKYWGIIIVRGDQCSWLSRVTLAHKFQSPRTNTKSFVLYLLKLSRLHNQRTYVFTNQENVGYLRTMTRQYILIGN